MQRPDFGAYISETAQLGQAEGSHRFRKPMSPSVAASRTPAKPQSKPPPRSRKPAKIPSKFRTPPQGSIQTPKRSHSTRSPTEPAGRSPPPPPPIPMEKTSPGKTQPAASAARRSPRAPAAANPPAPGAAPEPPAPKSKPIPP